MHLTTRDVVAAALAAFAAYAIARTPGIPEAIGQALAGEGTDVSRKVRKANRRARTYARKWAAEIRRADELETQLRQERERRPGIFRRMVRWVFG